MGLDAWMKINNYDDDARKLVFLVSVGLWELQDHLEGIVNNTIININNNTAYSMEIVSDI